MSDYLMVDRLLALVYLLGICIGGFVAAYGFVFFIEVRPGGKPMGTTGIVLGIALVATACTCIKGLKPKKMARSPIQ